jgi:hypothetical protein
LRDLDLLFPQAAKHPYGDEKSLCPLRGATSRLERIPGRHAVPVTQTGDPGAAGPPAPRHIRWAGPIDCLIFDDLSQPVRDRTEKPVPCVNDLVRRVLSTLPGRIASKRRTAEVSSGPLFNPPWADGAIAKFW